MNNLFFNIKNLPEKELPILSDDEYFNRFNTRWTFLNIYSLTALRDIYIITKEVECKTIKAITEEVNKKQINKTHDNQWAAFTQRQVLENLNALVKFELLDNSYHVKKNCFIDSEINSKLSESDRITLEHIFFNYHRFKEVSSWFIDPSYEFHIKFDTLKKEDFIKDPILLYYFSNESRFYNTFLRNLDTPYYRYSIKSDVLMRFWDVYIKWGTTLDLIDRFNISKITGIKKKEINIAYFIRRLEKFNLIEFITKNFKSRNIWIPELIFNIAKEHCYSVKDIKQCIVENVLSNDKITFERTSEIFLIKGKTSNKNIQEATYLYPLIDDFYISNLIIRR